MSLGPVVDIGIGLIFIYLLLGLITTALQEAGAGLLKLRGKQLKNSISDLVSDGDKLAPLFEQVFGHPLISGTAATNLPSYVPSRNFALALVDTLSSGSQGTVFSQLENGVAKMAPGCARDALEFFVKDAAGDLDKLKVAIATWYDDAMDRLSGVYKRYSQLFAIVVGLALAVGLNIDSINIARTLWLQDALRDKVAAAAQAYSQSHTTLPNDTVGANYQEFLDLQLPIGWTPAQAPGKDQTACATAGAVKTAGHPAAAVMAGGTQAQGKAGNCVEATPAWIDTVGRYFADRGWGGGLLVILGWLITGLATSLGAPFWFDTLKNILSMRSSGPKPPRADEAAS